MDSINSRIKELRCALNMSQEALGKVLGIKRSGVSNIESNLRNVTEQHIKFIIHENFSGKMVNEEWLRTGDGSMFIELSDNATYHEAASKLSNDPFVVAILTEYYKRDDNFKKSLAEFIQDISKHLEEHGE